MTAAPEEYTGPKGLYTITIWRKEPNYFEWKVSVGNIDVTPATHFASTLRGAHKDSHAHIDSVLCLLLAAVRTSPGGRSGSTG